ncbi:potassium channel protein, partial [bacterium]|nr:potassium channel protein [candidate division CSSED10-310 bacterium]
IVVADVDLLESVVSECVAEKKAFVIVHSKAYTNLEESIAGIVNEARYIQGDPTSDDVLQKAQINSADRILIATSDDTTNMYVLVTARSLNPKIVTVVRVNKKETEGKFKAVGADYVISTSTILGRLFLNAVMHPETYGFITKLHTRTEDPFLEVVSVDPDFYGKSVRDNIPDAVAILRKGTYFYNLQTMKLEPDDRILCLRTIFTQKNTLSEVPQRDR